ncbi:Uncharacterised protein [[Clostridium] sordellii]|uniref:hypothetical protein n=1 Tax=Paraclostridium sordellii TaxID=1505 RepID=UPI0005DA75B2|nr:hypothetical protein [Paeniclostridium sordellii]CEP50295.1 Uncharacterised protein [[Clostridium] sordellii] [Paeniclostridium sordellii]
MKVKLDVSCCNCENFAVSGEGKEYCLKDKKNIDLFGFCKKFKEDEFIKYIK